MGEAKRRQDLGIPPRKKISDINKLKIWAKQKEGKY